MSKKRTLFQLQLSNYTPQLKFVLEADSGWQMSIGRARVMLAQNPDLHIDILGPIVDNVHSVKSQVITHPYDVNPDLWKKYGPRGEGRLRYLQTIIVPNALVTRYDFDWAGIVECLGLSDHKVDPSIRYDAVYINDPMLLRNYKAAFYIAAGYTPKFFAHSHFIDNLECPKFPIEASLWYGQCEAAIKADFNFWQCESSMNVFFESMSKHYVKDVVDKVREKSEPWDDGYSTEEINTQPDVSLMRFSEEEFNRVTNGKTVIFVPNRIGGRGRSSDYTNCGKFMFDVLPELRKRRSDFVVIAGNPSQKFSNDELLSECGPNGYVKLVPDALTRDEFKFVARRSHIAVGLYDQDSYGGTVARECIDLGCVPLWIDKYEYSTIARKAGVSSLLAMNDFSDLVEVADMLIDSCQDEAWRYDCNDRLRSVVVKKCSYESTTQSAMKKMGLV